MTDLEPGAFRELVRAYAFARREGLGDAERRTFRERYEEHAREGRELLPPNEMAAGVLWRCALRSLKALPARWTEGPAWVSRRMGPEEHELVEAYAEAHVDLLCATQSGQAHQDLLRPRRHEIFAEDRSIEEGVEGVERGSSREGTPIYGVADLLDAWRRAEEAPSDGMADHALECFCRAFGVTFRERKVAPGKRQHLRLLKAMLWRGVHLPHPLAGSLEAGVFHPAFSRELSALSSKGGELQAFYHRAATEAAAELWGDLGERTELQLRLCGYSRMIRHCFPDDDDI